MQINARKIYLGSPIKNVLEGEKAIAFRQLR